MAISTISTSDSLLNSYLGIIRSAEFGRVARSVIANSVDRLYTIAVIKAGGAKNGVTRAKIDEHITRINNAVYGEEVRDALKTGITLCYSARDISLSSDQNTYLNNLINSQIGEDLKNAIINVIAKCCQDVKNE